MISWCNLKHSPCNATACAVNVMSFCMQPDGRNAHICGSKAAGVKTPKHPLHRCLDFSIMRYGDGRSWRDSRDGPYGPMGALLWDDCATASCLYFHAVVFNLLLSSPSSCRGGRHSPFLLFSFQGWLFFRPQRQNLWTGRITTAALCTSQLWPVRGLMSDLAIRS